MNKGFQFIYQKQNHKKCAFSLNTKLTLIIFEIIMTKILNSKPPYFLLIMFKKNTSLAQRKTFQKNMYLIHFESTLGNMKIKHFFFHKKKNSYSIIRTIN